MCIQNKNNRYKKTSVPQLWGVQGLDLMASRGRKSKLKNVDEQVCEFENERLFEENRLLEKQVADKNREIGKLIIDLNVMKNAKIDLLDSRKRELDSAHDSIAKMREEDTKLRAEITRLTQIIENIGKSPKTDTARFGLLEID